MIQDITQNDLDPTTVDRLEYCDDRNFCSGATSPFEICHGHNTAYNLYS